MRTLALLLILIVSQAGFASPFKQERAADRLLDQRRGLLLHRPQPNSAKAHRKRVLEALAKEQGRDRAKKVKATYRVEPRKLSERTNFGFQ